MRTSEEDEVLAEALRHLDVEEYGCAGCAGSPHPDDDRGLVVGGIEKVTGSVTTPMQIAGSGPSTDGGEEEGNRKGVYSGGGTPAWLTPIAPLAGP